MALLLVTNPVTYLALSTDTKPTGCPVGSTLQELDTGERFIWDGDGWVDDLSLIHALDAVMGD